MKSLRYPIHRICHVIGFVWQMFQYITWYFLPFFHSSYELLAEIVALRSQLALYQLQQEKGVISKPKCTLSFRLTWIFLSQIFDGWKDILCIVKPETVIKWHRAGFRMYWRYKSRPKNGRPVVSAEMRNLTRKISVENPLWSPERIHNQLVDLGFDPPSPNTIRKYLPNPTKNSNRSSQTWKKFISNHMDVTWSTDFFIVPTITFRILYIFIIISHKRRKIIRFGVTH
jgi:hypothetical protein